jgi:hypothetical protein
MENLIQCEAFNTVQELSAHLAGMIRVYGPTLADSSVEVISPDDRSTAPYVREVQVWQDTLSDSSVVFNLRIVMGEA